MAFQSFLTNLFVGPVQEDSKQDTLDPQTKFIKSIERERARTDRNGNGFSLISYSVNKSKLDRPSNRRLLSILPERMRLTDELGWIDNEHVGVLLYATKWEDAGRFAAQIDDTILSEGLPAPVYNIYSYPSSPDFPDRGSGNKDKEKQSAQIFEPDTFRNGSGYILTANYAMPKWKRLMDIVGAFTGLVLLAPFFLLIAAVIKIMSPGPVFFKQERIGLGGKPFVFLKFRTMKVDVDNTAHQQLLAELIKNGSHTDSEGKPMTKLDQADPQIIPFGKFLRKSCIDELPQLINVLIGDMSLIGPRPPIRYEVCEYDIWHQARLGVMPGMTGLWQVSGKNRLTFKEMVRLDIRYYRKRSIWLDLKILILTPGAILSQVKDTL